MTFLCSQAPSSSCNQEKLEVTVADSLSKVMTIVVTEVLNGRKDKIGMTYNYCLFRKILKWNHITLLFMFH